MHRTLRDRPAPLWLKVRTWLVQAMAIALLVFLIVPAHAQESSGAGNPVEGYPVVLDGEVLFRVQQGIPGVATAEERSKVINERIVKLANDPTIPLESIRAEGTNDQAVIRSGDTLLFTLDGKDLAPGQSSVAIANQLAQKTQSEIKQYRDKRSFKQVLLNVLFAILSTVALVIFLLLVQRLAHSLLVTIRLARQADALDLRVQNFQLLNSDATSFLLQGLVSLLRLGLVLGALYLYIPFLLSQFPATSALGKSIFADISGQVDYLIHGFVQYLPKLGVLAVIGFLTHYTIQFARIVINGLGRDDAYPWFYPEWTQPTFRIATFVILAIAAIIAAPFLPGFGSPAFQGVSLFVGALFTLGSSSAISNVIAGVILDYTRAFSLGDTIRIGEVMGEVVEKSLFVTRIKTFKKEIVTIPNSSVLNDQVINFNASQRDMDEYVLLHTTVTLGYDVPWRKIHEVMIRAAVDVPEIVATPEPFVLQTSLNDFNVSYELNAFTDHPELMPWIYSQLHQNLQDYCNQAEIEILSPGYTSIRDGNHTTIPGDYLPKDYTSPAFQIQGRNGQSQ
jgi:small-conductance mechanosensitive channel